MTDNEKAKERNPGDGKEPIHIETTTSDGLSRVHSFLEVVAITDVERDRDGIAARCFTDFELAELSAKQTQTMTGFLAVKKALVALFSAAGGHGNFSEKDFILSHRTDGSPQLLSLPDSDTGAELAADKVHISISHTRKRAYGLAACQEEIHG